VPSGPAALWQHGTIVGQSPIEQVASAPQLVVQLPPSQFSMRQSEVPSQVSAQEPPSQLSMRQSEAPSQVSAQEPSGQLPITQVESLQPIEQSVRQLSMLHELSVQAELQWPSAQLWTWHELPWTHSSEQPTTQSVMVHELSGPTQRWLQPPDVQ
jgi:hypothetical protein